jgi:hypothetical protein|tara:strand:- start:86 stop:304 length:219 start_codon:yes stop_codon:yes gene_type:complete
MKKLSKAVKRALKAGAIPPVRGRIKHYTPKIRNNCRRGEREWAINQHGGDQQTRVEFKHRTGIVYDINPEKD